MNRNVYKNKDYVEKGCSNFKKLTNYSNKRYKLNTNRTMKIKHIILILAKNKKKQPYKKGKKLKNIYSKQLKKDTFRELMNRNGNNF